jgi:hypothetical protein
VRSAAKVVDARTTASAAVEESNWARRPGVSGRVKSGRAVRHLPEPVKITPLEVSELAEERVKPRRVTPARPTPAPATAKLPRETKPKKTLTQTVVPAPTYTLMPDAPKWEPRGLTDLDYAQARQAATKATERAAAEARAEGVELAVTGELKIPGRVVFADGALDLDRAIAARRRAAGR